MQLGYVLGGSIVIESLFSYPGLGYLFYTATTDHDLPLMQGLFLFYTLAVLVCVLIADLLTAVLDPRTREAADGDRPLRLDCSRDRSGFRRRRGGIAPALHASGL